ncbi:killer cell lectin-like receptor subfamily B member 1A [Zootoca vivipara]|uniref:killer cell lectin-like receptor subfamily B member 1A n=1 Tax=Zootoca vivipara TaxID=8524 RepID=UPI00293BC6F9|nr:killer cell lectin-like receptor subfamily B member 1A [Zootoca vivipara]
MNKGSHLTRVHCQVEDAPCYFNFRPRENQGRHKPKFPMQAVIHQTSGRSEFLPGTGKMGLFYAYVLKYEKQGKLALLLLALVDDLLRQARRHRFIIVSGCVTIFILVGAMIALSFWGKDLKTEHYPQTVLNEARQCIVNSKSNWWSFGAWCLGSLGCPLTAHLASWFCLLPENSDCRLCPENWQRHGDKCYWISREKETWNKSRNDCAAKDSQLAVIQKQVELDFIHHKTEGGQLLWIGVTTMPPAHEWSWVDGSPLNDTLLQVTGLAEANSCGMLKGNRVNSEACSAVAKWICETEVHLV